jgi:type IV secretion system protein VirD4
MPAKYGLTTAKPAKTFRWLYLPFMLLLGLGSMVLATQRIAAFWSYQPALGKPLFTAFGQPWYAPWSALEWQSRLKVHDAYGFMEQAVTQSGSGHDKVDQ